MATRKRIRTKSLENNTQSKSVCVSNSNRLKRSRTEQLSTFPFLSSSEPIDVHKLSNLVLPPARKHPSSYHRPALLDNGAAQKALLDWFQCVSQNRDMPWRQRWIDPESIEEEEHGLDLRERLKRRAYQVWVSEIMLQQTRVETVRSYFEAWHSRWPTIEDLAKASPEDVLSAWRGLGYYSRATRLHAAAKKIVSDPEMDGMLPELPDDLEAKVPGVGRYTAGAVSSIVFGHAVPILDGNVSRVLCRQMGLYANMSSKATTSMLWEAADTLVKEATRDVLMERGIPKNTDVPKSDVPSFWNQALMELGSTLCKPQKPDCTMCPIRNTCMAYAEGERLAHKAGLLDLKDSSDLEVSISGAGSLDIEDLCALCGSMDAEDEPTTISSTVSSNGSKINSKNTKLPATKKSKQTKLSFGQSGSSNPPESATVSNLEHQRLAKEMIEKHVTLFPLKTVKTAVRKEECIVCVVERPVGAESKWLIEQRPDKGLLASLWQFPSLTIFSDNERVVDTVEDENRSDEEEANDDLEKPSKKRTTKAKTTAKSKIIAKRKPTVQESLTPPSPPNLAQRNHIATRFAKSLTKELDSQTKGSRSAPQIVHHIKELGSITHLFSHIRLVMHIHIFEVNTRKRKHDSDASEGDEPQQDQYQQRKWASKQEVKDENFGTGMRRCWAFALKENNG